MFIPPGIRVQFPPLLVPHNSPPLTYPLIFSSNSVTSPLVSLLQIHELMQDPADF